MKKLFIMALALFCVNTGFSREANYQTLKSMFAESRSSLTEEDVKNFIKLENVKCLAMNKSNLSNNLKVNLKNIELKPEQGPAFPSINIDVILLGEALYTQELKKIKYQAVPSNNGLEVTTLRTLLEVECYEVRDDIQCSSTVKSQLPVKTVFRISEEKYLTYNDVTNDTFGYCWQN